MWYLRKHNLFICEDDKKSIKQVKYTAVDLCNLQNVTVTDTELFKIRVLCKHYMLRILRAQLHFTFSRSHVTGTKTSTPHQTKITDVILIKQR